MNGAREASEQFEFESLNSGTASPIEGQKVSRMKPGHHQRRLFQHLLGHPDFAHGLHTQQITRKAESLIKMGYIDESWRVTEEGKSKLLREQQQQQIQESSNEPSQMIGADINNAATQAELLRAEQLSLSTTPNWRSLPRPRLSRSITFRRASKVLSTVRPRSLLLSNRSRQPGRFGLLKLKLASLN
jgi:hypothetical protein